MKTMKTTLIILAVLLTGCASTGETTSPFMQGLARGLVSGIVSGASRSTVYVQPTNRQITCNTRYGVDIFGNTMAQTNCN